MNYQEIQDKMEELDEQIWKLKNEKSKLHTKLLADIEGPLTDILKDTTWEIKGPRLISTNFDILKPFLKLYEESDSIFPAFEHWSLSIAPGMNEDNPVLFRRDDGELSIGYFANQEDLISFVNKYDLIVSVHRFDNQIKDYQRCIELQEKNKAEVIAKVKRWTNKKP